jgi:hypothetical protein
MSSSAVQSDQKETSSGYCASCSAKLRLTPMGNLKRGKRVNQDGSIDYAFCFDCKICCPKINCWCPTGQGKMWSESIESLKTEGDKA